MLDDLPRPGLWKRLIAGAFLVIFAAAAATAVAAFHEVDKIVGALELSPELKLGTDTLATTDPASRRRCSSSDRTSARSRTWKARAARYRTRSCSCA
jgi:hypothetical protein